MVSPLASLAGLQDVTIRSYLVSQDREPDILVVCCLSVMRDLHCARSNESESDHDPSARLTRMGVPKTFRHCRRTSSPRELSVR